MVISAQQFMAGALQPSLLLNPPLLLDVTRLSLISLAICVRIVPVRRTTLLLPLLAPSPFAGECPCGRLDNGDELVHGSRA